MARKRGVVLLRGFDTLMHTMVLRANKWCQSTFCNADNMGSLLVYSIIPKMPLIRWLVFNLEINLTVNNLVVTIRWRERWAPLSTAKFCWPVKIKSIHDKELRVCGLVQISIVQDHEFKWWSKFVLLHC